MSSGCRLLPPARRGAIRAAWALLAAAACTVGAGAAALRSDPTFLPEATQWRQLSRTLSLLRSSTAEHRQTVKLLFYGQSITQQDWTRQLAAWMRTNFPLANLVIENRAIGGLEADRLKRTAVADVVGWQPDLLILHCYGYEPDVDELLGLVRAGTAADILLQGDQVWEPNGLNEPTDPAVIPESDYWAYRNYVWLPRLAQRHGACLADIRTQWKAYLRRHNLNYHALLDVNVSHLNDEGNLLLGALLESYFQRPGAPPLIPPFDEPRAQIAEVGRDVDWDNHELNLDFTGRRVEVVTTGRAAGKIEVLIDGRKPSSIPELYSFSRVSNTYGRQWPALLQVSFQTPPVIEDWTATITSMTPRGEHATFSVSGSVTGPDGAAGDGHRFVSNSGRIVIEPRDWMIGLAAYYSGQIPPPDYRIHWQVLSNFVDEFMPDTSANPAIESTVELARGLSAGSHHLTLRSRDRGGGLKEIRVFGPPGQAAIAGLPPRFPAQINGLETRVVGEDLWAVWPASWVGARIEMSEAFPAVIWSTPLGSEPFPTNQVSAARLPQGAKTGWFRVVRPQP